MLTFLAARFPFIADYLGSDSSLRQKLVGGFAWALAAKVSIAILGLLLNAILAQLMTPDEVGGYFLALSIIAVLGAITLLGLKQTTVKLVAESQAIDQPGRTMKAIWWVALLGSIGALIGGLFLILGGGRWLGDRLFDSPLIGDLSLLIGVWLIVSNLQTLVAEVFRGFQDLRWASLFGGQGALTRLLTVFLLMIVWQIFSNSNLRQVISLIVISNVITLMAALGLLCRRIYAIGKSHGNLLLKELFSLAWPLWLNSLGLLGLNQAATIFLGALRPEREVALYGVADRLSQMISLPFLIINAVLPPIIVELYTKGQKLRLERLLRTTATLLTMPAVGVFFLYAIFGKQLLNVVFGEYYIHAYWPLLILSLGHVIIVGTGSSGLLMIMSGFHKQYMRATLGIGILNVCFYTWAIKSYGVVGGAIIAMSGLGATAVLVMFYSFYKIKVRTWPIISMLKLKS